MTDTSPSRYRAKAMIDDKLMLDGCMCLGLLQTSLDTLLGSFNAPRLDVSIMDQYRGGQFLTFAIGIGQFTLHIEIETLCDPGERPSASQLRRHGV